MSEDTAELVAGAHTAFADAVHALIGLRPDHIIRDNHTEPVILDSIYSELLEARFGEKREQESVRRSVHGSNAPGNTDIISLLDRIDRTTRRWWPTAPTEPESQPATVRRLYALTDHRWEPHMVGLLRRRTHQIESWVTRGNWLLAHETRHQWELRAPCPACGETVTSVDDGHGELVRKYVLQASASSAMCVACETVWAPEHFRNLAAQIGAGMPTGVLE